MSGARSQAQDVFRTDIRSLGRIGVRWAWDLSFGGALRHVQPKSLLDTAPLRKLLAAHPLGAHRSECARAAHSYAVAVAATDLLHRQRRICSSQGHPEIRPWKRSRWRIEPTQHDHRPSDGIERHPDLLPVDRDRRAAISATAASATPRRSVRRSTSVPTASSPSACRGRAPAEADARRSGRRPPSRRSPACCSTP